jgi:predicted PurR-regulated permease PerM
MGPALLLVLLLFVIVTVPVFVAAVTFINRETGSGTDEDVAELEQRVEELESEQN